ncbi:MULTISPECIES: CHAP domain-containing protein [unclassified Caulobacter]|uniref:CHAP domain-containing protein n=1 Tax=unclassified Caulobacter TaxID=2648921 RepID=UPI000D3A7692|nr:MULTISPECIES: CHAP domain-containing protein [unclassified Caulobacter]PTS83896.1 CHAP domain-containing protein [Caulobacter sp. HMWF009]PTT06388.1 CHAP domain-containing protein [Caulobacter sp. HMWF025]PTT75182.1 CHAP domain-containing protein [Pseudomonas sp. HMWF010]
MTKRTRTLWGSLAAAAMISLLPVSGAVADGYWQCVPFARLMSGIQIFGDARTWWSQAAGKYDTGTVPKIGSVLSFKPTGRMTLGHVAFVSQVLTDRVIQVTHANWSVIDGGRGQVETDVTVVDVSPNGDWSEVKVWYDPIRDLGTTVYPTHGFIYQNAQATKIAAATSKIALAQNAVVSVAKQAANQVAASVRASPLDIITQAADSTDRIAALIEAATQSDSDKPAPPR